MFYQLAIEYISHACMHLHYIDKPSIHSPKSVLEDNIDEQNFMILRKTFADYLLLPQMQM